MYKKTIIVGTLVLTMGWFAMGADMCAAAGSMQGTAEGSLSGVVVETTNASRYTYVQIDTGKEKIWAAGPVFAVKVGDRVTVEGGMPAKNFKSKVLNRTFPDLTLAGSITLAGGECPSHAEGAGKMPAGHPSITGKGEMAAAPDMAVIQKPEGGKTVAEIWSDKAALSGKTVLVRGKVVKVTPKILGMNWLHLRDGSGAEGSNDLVVTTKAEVKAEDVVTVSGTLNTDKDFGSGYKYDVILENATVIVK
jgi:hypothetical protein